MSPISAAFASLLLLAPQTPATGPTASPVQPPDETTAKPAAKTPPGAEGSTVAPGTKKMAELLAKIAKDADPDGSPFFTDKRAKLFGKRAARSEGGPREIDLRLAYAKELLLSGQPEAGLAEADKIEALLAKPGASTTHAIGDSLERLRALCWVRLGEVENCVGHHCCNSCILPIQAGGVHSQKRGSEHAIEVLMQLLAKDSRDYESRWLLNLAHMTLGTWPDGVPEKYRFGPELFTAEYDLPKFRDVASECGVAINNISGGASAEDFDRDGFLDLITTSIGLSDQMHYFHSNGDGTFEDRTAQAGLTGLTGGLNTLHGDYDNDGWTDVVVLRGAWFDEEGRMPLSLIRNRGDGTFEDVTEAAGLLRLHPTQTGALADFDGDGWLDLVVGNETQHSKLPHPCELFLNQRDGTFKNVAREAGADVVGFVKGVAVGDFDDDGRPDVYYSRRGQTNLLKRNVADATPGGPGLKFVDVEGRRPPMMPTWSFPTWFFDYDNDGKLDLFVATNMGFSQKQNDAVGEFMAGVARDQEMPCLWHNEGNGEFQDVAKEMGVARAILSMGSNYGDFDNDGWLDIYLGNGSPSFASLLPNKAFRNDRGKRFQDVTTSSGLGHLQKGHGVAFADFDNDGDQDVFLDTGGGFTGDFYQACLFENPGNANHWITLQLQGVKANRSAIGARIRVDVTTPSGARSIHVVCGTGGSFGASTLQQEIGLGDATAVNAIFIRWPGSDTKQTLSGAQLDRVYRIIEGTDALQEVAVKRLKLGG